MKQIFTLVSACILSLSAIAQSSDHLQIEDRIATYFQATQEKNWSLVVDMVYPKLFEIVSKDEMLNLFESMEADGIVITMKDFKVKRITDPLDHNGESFVRVDYSFNMNMRFENDSNKDDNMKEFLLQSFKASFGNDNVTYESSDNSYEIHGDKIMFAIAASGSPDWYFIERNDDMADLMNTLIPEIVVSKLAIQSTNE